MAKKTKPQEDSTLSDNQFPAPGTRLRFLGEPHPETGAQGHFGSHGEVHSLAGAPDGNHEIPIGTIGTVLVGHDLDENGRQKSDSAVIPSHITGAGTDVHDVAIVSFETRSAYVDDKGQAALALGSRNVAFTLEQLNDWFEPVSAIEESFSNDLSAEPPADPVDDAVDA